MTNEELLRRYDNGDESALEKLYHKNMAFIRSIAIEAANDFHCLQRQESSSDQFSPYTKEILEDLCAEGALEFWERVQSRGYDESRGMFITYLHPHLMGRMRRWLEQNIGSLSLDKDTMEQIRKAQKLYHTDGMDIPEIASELGISEKRAARHVRYNTHFLSVHDIVPEDYEGDSYELLMPGRLSAPAERIVYRKVCIELLRELFDQLPKKDRDILGRACGVFGYKKEPLHEIGMRHMMKESAVEKAKARAIKKLEKAYPGSALQVWRSVHRMMRRPILPQADDAELRVCFPQHVRALAEAYGILSETSTKGK